MLKIALTQTRNCYPDMPASAAEVGALAGQLEALREANLAHHVSLIRQAAAAGAKVVGLGELFGMPYFAHQPLDLWLDLAEDARTGPTQERIRQVALETGVVVIAPIYELAGDKRFNTALVVSEQGQLIGCYRKTHIPQGRNERGSFHEAHFFLPSDGKMFVDPRYNISNNPFFPVFRTSFADIGVAICYDRHFDGVMRSLAAGGAQLVLCPAVTYGAKSERMWRHEFASDAARHRLFIAGSNRQGSEPPWPIRYFGDSHVVGPEGVLEDLADAEELVIVEVDLASLRETDSSGWKLSADRRSDIYSP